MQPVRTWFPPWLLFKFISLDVLVSFILGSAVFIFLMLTFQAIRLSEFLVIHQAGLSDILKITVYLLLSFVPIALPVAFLFAVLIGISRASADGEILALYMAGLSRIRIFTPVGCISVIVGTVCAYLSLYTVPRANRSFELMITKIDSERIIASLKPGVFLHGFYGLVLLAEQIIPGQNKMKRVFIYDNRDNTHPLTITAKDGVLKDFPDKGIRTLRLSNGTIHLEKDAHSVNQQKIDFKIYDINLQAGEDSSAWRDYSPPSYDYSQLAKRISETSADPPIHNRLLIELHRRLSLAFSVFIFGVLGFVLGARSQRGLRSSAIVLCLFIGLLYWLSYVVANALAATGWVLPWAGIWTPNILLLAASGLMARMT
jgi:lipopolysaccharide export system permease protein